MGGAWEPGRGRGAEGRAGWAFLEPSSHRRVRCELAHAVPDGARPLERGRSAGEGGGLSVLGWLAGAEHRQGELAGARVSQVCSLCV